MTSITFDLLADTAKQLALPAGGTCWYFANPISVMRRLSDDYDMISDAEFSSVFSIDASEQFLNISLPANWSS